MSLKWIKISNSNIWEILQIGSYHRDIVSLSTIQNTETNKNDRKNAHLSFCYILDLFHPKNKLNDHVIECTLIAIKRINNLSGRMHVQLLILSFFFFVGGGGGDLHID